MTTPLLLISARRTGLFLLLPLLMALLAPICIGQTSGDDVMIYSEELGVDVPPPSACFPDSGWPYSGCYSMAEPFGYLPALGYPMHWAIFAGLNDTLSFWIDFYNTSDTTCDLADKDCEYWYIPRLYLADAIGPGATPLDESDSLGFRIRGWYLGRNRVEPQKELPHMPNGGLCLVMNVWNIPQGRFQICLEPTNKVPKDFVAWPGGLSYEFYPPQSLADSIDGYWGCFERAMWDKDYSSAGNWVKEMLAVNPTSVPGNWYQAFLALAMHDTATAKQALDDASKYLHDGSDPAMPDSTVRPLFEAEKLYRFEMGRVLGRERRRLGP
jgi:hypothetical protein